MRTVFLSSTAKDLAPYREAAYRAIEGLDEFHCVRMEDFGARADRADKFCREKIAACDVAVFLVGLCHGSTPEGSAESYTEREYAAAAATGVPRLVFLSEEDNFYPGYYRESDEAWTAQKAFRAKVNTGAIREVFTTPDQLAAKVTQALANWVRATPERESCTGPALSATLTGSGAIAQNDSVAAGAGGVAVRGNVAGGIHVYPPGEKKEEEEEEEDPTRALRTAYLNRLFDQVSPLPLTGIDPKAASEAETRLTLGAVYTALLTETRERPQDPKNLEQPDREARRLSALELLDKHDRLVLLGDPGSGKTTFLNFVALCLAGEALDRPEANLGLLRTPVPIEDDEPRLRSRKDRKSKPRAQPWRWGPLLPVRVVLRDFAARGLPDRGEPAGAGHFWAFVRGELKRCGLEAFAEPLQAGMLEPGGLILLDGLDEVPEADRRRTQIRQVVEDLASTCHACRILVTSRTYAYQKQEWKLPEFTDAVLAPFSSTQVRTFVAAWYTHVGQLRGWPKDNTQGKATRLQQAIDGSDRLQGLAERPLLLTLMASLHAWRGGTLPDKREALYADGVDLLLDRWESQRTIDGPDGKPLLIQPSLAEWLKLDRDEVRRLIHRLAFDAHAAQPELAGTADIPEKELVAGLLALSPNLDIKPKQLVEYLHHRAGLLVPHGVGVYTFPHRTFQEYLAACHLTDQDYPEQVAELARTDPDRWREAVLLAGAKAAGGSASTIWALADALCFREPENGGWTMADHWGALLAGQALLESADTANVSERNRAKLDRVRNGLVRVLEGTELPAVERVLAGRVVAKLGDPREAVATIEGMEFCWVPGGPFWMGGQDGKPRKNKSLPDGYWIARFPVTNAQYRKFVEAGGYADGSLWDEAKAAECWADGAFKGRLDDEPRRGPVDSGEPFHLANHPVVGVSWYEAVAFARWLDRRFDLQGWKIGLATESQWEKGARGGVETPEEPTMRTIQSGLRPVPAGRGALLGPNPTPQREYPWGDGADPAWMNYEESEIGGTNAGGCYGEGRSPCGAQDLAGNVWEWCLTEFDEESRVLRGGAFDISAEFARCAFRGRYYPFSRYGNVGFRVAASPRR